MNTTQSTKNLRSLAANCVFLVVDKGRSLADILPVMQRQAAEKDKGLLQELCYGVLRYLPELEDNIRQLIEKPLTGKQRVIHFLLLIGVYQLKYTRIPDHAAVAETVAATKALKHAHLKGLVNAILRNYQRQSNSPSQANISEAVQYNHPSWLIKKLHLAYPNQWQTILAANQQKPPMWLRINQRKITIPDYLQLLTKANIAYTDPQPQTGAIKLEQPIDVFRLPNFVEGFVSIQDGAAQLAAILLACQAKQQVLDCCAAPGGKTCHLLERYPDIKELTALDVEQSRLEKVTENLQRLQLTAKLIGADASAPSTWWDGQLYDRILLDAPCSGTGVIRRHPDIKWLRKAHDIDKLCQLQRNILTAIWPLLKPGGSMLYVTCSILPDENQQQISWFLNQTKDATLVPLTTNETDIGWQLLPGTNDMDGFYYAKLTKKIELK